VHRTSGLPRFPRLIIVGGREDLPRLPGQHDQWWLRRSGVPDQHPLLV